jgi:hypothetical protein
MPIDVLHVRRRRLQDDLVLVVVLETIGVLAVASVGGSPAGLHIGRAPGIGAQNLEKCRRMERPGTNFQIIGFVDHAPPIGPETMQGKKQVLKGHPCCLPRGNRRLSPYTNAVEIVN